MKTMIDIKNLTISDREIELDVFDYVKNGTEYRFDAKSYDLEEESFLVRCDLLITRTNDEEPDIWIDNIELWEDDRIEISNEEAFIIEQKIKKSLTII